MYMYSQGGKHYELLGAECVGNRTEEQMVKICLTICSHVSYGGPGTIDDRCIGIKCRDHHLNLTLALTLTLTL